MKRGLVARALCLGVLFSAAVPAWALPFSLGAPATGKQGSLISASLFDGGVTQLEAADFLLTFDSAVFAFSGAATGSATSGFFLVAGSPVSIGGSLVQVEFSLATGGSPVDGTSGSLLEVDFLIKQKAPLGLSELVFASTPFSDYDIARTVGGVIVTQAQQVPEPGSLWILGVSALLLAAKRRWLCRTGA